MAKTSCSSFPESYPMALWNDILDGHFNYIAIDESLQKLQDRENLEVLLKEFLCIVPQDRKFFLPETKHVLKRSVAHMEDFSAYEASIGFDAISQYANNLLAKPWRKEYKTIKMYSGFYQHEVATKLVDAVKMFEAMGYTQMDNDVLVLQGPICFDQVANVSRDAMAAYVECQIMKDICAGLIKLKYSSRWIDIFNFREKYTGDSSHAVTAIAHRISDKHRVQKMDLIGTSACKACNINRTQSLKPIYDQPAAHNAACSLHCANQKVNNYQTAQPPHHQQQHHLAYVYPPNLPTQPTLTNHLHHHPASIPHSKSLEHYVDYATGQHPHFGLHSMSLDQPTTTFAHYEQPATHQQHYQSHHYDTVDTAYQTAAIPAAAATAGCSHPANYNVSGIRYPIPLNVSNQFIAEQYGTNGLPCSGSSSTSAYPLPPSTYAYVPPPPPPTTYNRMSVDRNYGTATFEQLNGARNNVRVEHLIDLDDHRSMQHQQPSVYLQNVCPVLRNPDDRHTMVSTTTAPTAAAAATLQSKKYDSAGPTSYAQAIKLGGISAPVQFNNHHQHHHHHRNELYDGNTINDRPDNSNAFYDQSKYARSSRTVPNYEQASPVAAPTINGSRNSRASDFDSIDDSGDYGTQRDTHNHHHYHQQQQQQQQQHYNSDAQSSKNHEGVGSFEQWNFVYKKLEKQGYSKDLGERGDLSVQGLDLNPPGITGANTADKKLIRAQEIVNKAAVAAAAATSVPSARNNGTAEPSHYDIERKSERAAPRANGSTTLSRKSVIYANPKSSVANGTLPSLNGGSHHRAKSNVTADVSPPVRSGGKMSKSGNGVTPASGAAAEVAEWNCRFCTFLNPGLIRICNMCAKSRDFIDSTSKATTTCV